MDYIEKMLIDFAWKLDEHYSGNEHPEDIEKLVDEFLTDYNPNDQPERSKREDSITYLEDLDKTVTYELCKCFGEIERKCREMRCSEHDKKVEEVLVEKKIVIGDCHKCDKVLYEGDVAWGFPHSDVFECHDCYEKEPDDLERDDENGMDKR